MNRVVIALLIANGLSQVTAAEWCEGGNLHKATMAVWSKAEYANRLATASDFTAKVLKPKSMAELRKKAGDLEACLSSAAAKRKDEKASDVAALCAVILWSDELK